MAEARSHLVVIGGGIVGVSTAFHARLRGWDVTLLDPRGVAGGASSGNAGILAVSECVPVGTPGTLRAVPRMLLARDGPLHIRPSYLPRMLPWLLQLLRASTPARVEALSKVLAGLLGEALQAHLELAGAAGVRHRIARSGWLKAFETVAGFAGARADIDLMRRRGVACETLDAQALADREPVLQDGFARAVFHPDCHHVGEPAAYVRAIGSHLVRMGVSVREEEARGFDLMSGRVTAVRTRAGPVAADAIVLAAGAWSRDLALQLGCDVPLDTERGYHMVLDTSACRARLRHPLYWADKAIVLSPMGEQLRVTSSVEFAGLHAAPAFDRVLRHLPAVQRILPGAELVPGSTWLGFRPSIPDSLPVIGAVPRLANAVLAFGHGHLGLTLGPITGKLACQLLDGGPTQVPLEAFSPLRFGTGRPARPVPMRVATCVLPASAARPAPRPDPRPPYPRS